MISLSDTAAHRVKSYIEKRGKGVGLRLGVKTTGCSGMAYVIEFADEVQPTDKVFDEKGVKVIIDPKFLVYTVLLVDLVPEVLNLILVLRQSYSS